MMAGRPKRRARLEAMAQIEFPKPGKPLTEMDASEREAFRRDLRKFQRDLNRPQREADLRAGKVRPRNRAETELFLSDLRDRRADDGQETTT
jgi:hypothetical protein